MKKASKRVIVLNMDNTVHGEYPSIAETAENMNCSVKTIYRSLRSPDNLLKKRWIVKFK